jgi:hypothetical protein
MTTVKLHPKPTVSAPEGPKAAIVNASHEPVTITDSLERQITIKKLGPVERLRMLKLIGGFNIHYMGEASLVFLVTSIDGIPVNRPTTELQIEALYQKLGDEGTLAVAQAAQEHFGVTESADDRDALKNS